jgi:hypothetical protein
MVKIGDGGHPEGCPLDAITAYHDNQQRAYHDHRLSSTHGKIAGNR